MNLLEITVKKLIRVFGDDPDKEKSARGMLSQLDSKALEFISEFIDKSYEIIKKNLYVETLDKGKLGEQLNELILKEEATLLAFQPDSYLEDRRQDSKLVTEIGQRITREIRIYDKVYKLSGGQFIVLLYKTDITGGWVVGKRLLDEFYETKFYRDYNSMSHMLVGENVYCTEEGKLVAIPANLSKYEEIGKLAFKCGVTDYKVCSDIDEMISNVNRAANQAEPNKIMCYVGDGKFEDAEKLFGEEQ